MRSFDDLPTLASSPESSPRRPPRRSMARRCERACMSCLTLFPLVFVYGLTTWAVYVQACIGLFDAPARFIGKPTAFLGIALYILLNWSYSIAVFTDPGSPLTSNTNAYSALPTHDSPTHAPSAHSLTVKSTGETRYCKKCQARKPDRAHHCSTCRRCVLKMDHHCPWLATCVGLRNYKAFLLFLLYVVLFCWLCCLVSGLWTLYAIFGDVDFGASERLMPVNNILLAVLSGILGLVLAGFTGWHVYLTLTGQTTIESLEKNRYISPLKKNLQAQLDPDRHRVGNEQTLGSQLREMHANAVPGITRPEEGESRPTPAQNSLRMSYAQSEAAHERARYQSYLDELDSAKLPNAFDHGWRSNTRAVLGPNPLLWPFPICNSEGDGWNWTPSPDWVRAREEMAERRAQASGYPQEQQQYPAYGNGHAPPPRRFDAPAVPEEDEDDDDDAHSQSTRLLPNGHSANPNAGRGGGGQWNDVPDDMLAPGQGRGVVRTRSPRPARAYPDR